MSALLLIVICVALLAVLTTALWLYASIVYRKLHRNPATRTLAWPVLTGVGALVGSAGVIGSLFGPYPGLWGPASLVFGVCWGVIRDTGAGARGGWYPRLDRGLRSGELLVTLGGALGTLLAYLITLTATTGGVAWWRAEQLPSAAEWQAFWAFTTFVVALVAAWIALRQVIAMWHANRLAAEASIAAMRPYVVVSFEIDPAVPKNPKSSAGSGFALIVIENIGKTPALDLTLKSVPEFVASGDGAPNEGSERMLSWIREKFSGEYVFSFLPPGRRYEYVLDTTIGLMEPGIGLPQVYEVEARYRSQGGVRGEFVETNMLDAEPWNNSSIRPDPATGLNATTKMRRATTGRR